MFIFNHRKDTLAYIGMTSRTRLVMNKATGMQSN